MGPRHYEISMWKIPKAYIVNLLEAVEVSDNGVRNFLGSNDLVKGKGSSWRKYSSGVLNSIPIFVAKSLIYVQYITSLKAFNWAYLSEHE